MTTALVLAGGGVAGIAWQTGMLLGLRDAGVDLTAPDLLVGTSAGSTVGAQVLSGVDLEELFARQVAGEHQELTPPVDLARLLAFFAELDDLTAGPDVAALRRLGAFAKATETVGVAVRRSVVEWRLPSHEWPQVDLRVPAVDVDTGELVVLTRDSGVPLVDAVAASCAVPGVWPPVPVGGRVLMDGGSRSPTNLDLAAGHEDVVALVPMLALGAAQVEREAEELRRAGARVRLVPADEEATAAMGPNALDPAARRPAAEAGRRQGRTGLPGP